MLEQLFSSRVRVKILAAFFLAPGKSWNASELSKDLHENYSAVWKELFRLQKIGILTSQHQGTMKAYSLNLNCSITPELRSIFIKTDGLGAVIRAGLLELGNIKKSFIYGSFASGEADVTSDLDLMIIGDVELSALSSLVSEQEQRLGRSINYVIFSEDEWKAKKDSRDPFVNNVLNSPKYMLIGDEDAL